MITFGYFKTCTNNIKYKYFVNAGNASEPIPVFYQGCYNSSNMTAVTSTSGDCEQHCNNTRFFAVAKHVRSRFHFHMFLNIRNCKVYYCHIFTLKHTIYYINCGTH